MKFLVALIALAATALAAPADVEERNPPPPAKCTPATYGCAQNPSTHVDGWQVCDVTGTWVYAGDCPPKTHCYFLPANGSPYCVP